MHPTFRLLPPLLLATSHTLGDSTGYNQADENQEEDADTDSNDVGVTFLSSEWVLGGWCSRGGRVGQHGGVGEHGVVHPRRAYDSGVHHLG